MLVNPLANARPLDYTPDAGVFPWGRVERPHVHTIEMATPGGGLWTCDIPKDFAGHEQYRRRVILEADEDPALQRLLVALCAAGVNDPDPQRRYAATVSGCLYWLNTFCWTFRSKRIDADGREVSIIGGGADTPWILWPIQDDIVARIIHAIEFGHDIVVDKARDMGLTWLIAAVFTYYWLFRPKSKFCVMSRVEDLVDLPDDPDSIFWKIDYLIANLPAWMAPPMGPRDRKYMRIINRVNGATIIGRSTHRRQGRGMRVLAVLFDEAAHMEHLSSVWVAFGRTTNCRIANSTASEPGFFADLVRSPQVPKIDAPFWDHPGMGRGRYERFNEHTQEVEVRSPWLDREQDRAVDPREITQEILRDHRGSGQVVFPSVLLGRLRAGCLSPLYRGRIVWDPAEPEPMDTALRNRRFSAWWEDDEQGEWKIWTDLVEDEHGLWRPSQHRTYIFGIDISLGAGASNSVIVVKDLESDEQVGEWASPFIPPEQFARIAVLGALWWGGARGTAFLCWESNGPGGAFGNEVVHTLHHPWCYYDVDRTRRSLKRPANPKYGWHSSPATKKDAFLLTAAACRRDAFKVRSEPIIREWEQYVFYKTGGVQADVGPAQLEKDDTGARATHGDRAVAAVLAHIGSLYAHQCSPPDRIALPGSPAFRRQMAKEKRGAERVRSGRARRRSA